MGVVVLNLVLRISVSLTGITPALTVFAALVFKG